MSSVEGLLRNIDPIEQQFAQQFLMSNIQRWASSSHSDETRRALIHEGMTNLRRVLEDKPPRVMALFFDEAKLSWLQAHLPGETDVSLIPWEADPQVFVEVLKEEVQSATEDPEAYVQRTAW